VPLISNSFSILVHPAIALSLYWKLNTPRYAMTPDAMMISPTRLILSALFCTRLAAQLISSPANFSIRDLALAHFLSELS
jgi:hypothetical protein